MPQTAICIYRSANGKVPLTDWLNDLEQREPRAYAKCLERILRLADFGYELRRPIADALRDGIFELRAEAGNVNYRILYFFCGRNVVCLTHGCTKEKKVPPNEIDLAVRRKKQVEQNPELYTAEWEE